MTRSPGEEAHPFRGGRNRAARANRRSARNHRSAISSLSGAPALRALPALCPVGLDPVGPHEIARPVKDPLATQVAPCWNPRASGLSPPGDQGSGLKRTTSKGRARRGQGPPRPAAGPPCPDRRRDRDCRPSTLPPLKGVGFSAQRSMLTHGISDMVSPSVSRLRLTGGDGSVRVVSRRFGRVQERATWFSWPRPSLSCGGCLPGGPSPPDRGHHVLKGPLRTEVRPYGSSPGLVLARLKDILSYLCNYVIK